jgi:hypothetical protein
MNSPFQPLSLLLFDLVIGRRGLEKMKQWSMQSSTEESNIFIHTRHLKWTSPSKCLLRISERIITRSTTATQYQSSKKEFNYCVSFNKSEVLSFSCTRSLSKLMKFEGVEPYLLWLLNHEDTKKFKVEIHLRKPRF